MLSPGLLLLMGTAPAAPPPLVAPPVEETIHGVAVSDPFRWMEHPEHAVALEEWLRSESACSRAALAALPGRAALAARLAQLEGERPTVSGLQTRGSRAFYLERQAGWRVSRLVVREGDTQRILFDPEDRGVASIGSFSASPDGSKVALALASDGSELTHIRVLDVASGALSNHRVDHIWGEFPPSWLPDGSGILYTQMDAAALDRPDADPMQGMKGRWLHLGTGQAVDVFGPGVSERVVVEPTEFPLLWTTPGSPWILGVGMNARAEVHLAVLKVGELGQQPLPWRHVVGFDDGVVDAAVLDDHLYLLATGRSAHGEVLRVSAQQPEFSTADVVLPAGPSIRQQLASAEGGLFVVDMVDGSEGLEHWTGEESVRVAVPAGVDLTVADAGSHGLWMHAIGYNQPGAFFRRDGRTLVATELGDAPMPGYPDLSIQRTEAVSADGTTVPMTIIHRSNLPADGRRPTLVHGYGAYGITITPYYWPPLVAWVEQGGVYVACHTRGGGARGPAWHVAGRGKNKPAGARDFVACAERAAELGYTTAQHTGAWTASMGGLLVGGAMTASPDTFAAVVLDVPVLNPLRYLEADNGANQAAELDARPDSREGVETLLALDPYHQLREGVSYPATMVTLGLLDRRVPAWMSAKFPARLASLEEHTKPTLVWTDAEDGHGGGASTHQQVEKTADTFAFLLSQLGHPDFVHASGWGCAP